MLKVERFVNEIGISINLLCLGLLVHTATTTYYIKLVFNVF